MFQEESQIVPRRLVLPFRLLSFVTFLIFVTCFTPSTAFGQVAGRLAGSVMDASGAMVPGAQVKVMMPGGSEALLEGTTNSAGLFSFIAVQPGTYEVEVSASGFTKTRLAGVKVSPVQETNLAPIKLEVQAAQATVEVVAVSEGVQTANSEISSTVTARQVQSLPVLDRQVSSLFLTQPGVSSGRGPTVVNGMRTSFSNVTLDGINIQDNFIRSNSLDYIPTKTTIDQVAEITIATSNASTTIGGGGAHDLQFPAREDGHPRRRPELGTTGGGGRPLGRGLRHRRDLGVDRRRGRVREGRAA